MEYPKTEAISQGIPFEYISLCKDCCNENLDLRPNAQQIIEKLEKIEWSSVPLRLELPVEHLEFKLDDNFQYSSEEIS
ncbi:8807_t:CDS:2, partial [Ambispora leptoticha]